MKRILFNRMRSIQQHSITLKHLFQLLRNDGFGNCKVCPRNCKWNIHKNVPYICEIVEEEVMKTNKDLEEKYYSATNQKRTKEMMIDGLGRLYGKQQLDILNTVSAIRENISELKVSFRKK